MPQLDVPPVVWCQVHEHIRDRSEREVSFVQEWLCSRLRSAILLHILWIAKPPNLTSVLHLLQHFNPVRSCTLMGLVLVLVLLNLQLCCVVWLISVEVASSATMLSAPACFLTFQVTRTVFSLSGCRCYVQDWWRAAILVVLQSQLQGCTTRVVLQGRQCHRFVLGVAGPLYVQFFSPLFPRLDDTLVCGVRAARRFCQFHTEDL
mmetsp:Transcript_40772/g.101309  ORF Transcript_40772/g.101309 Transcript_40772/m.101309 type:complete len:205 (-) Transcript_40772:243-857(-)